MKRFLTQFDGNDNLQVPTFKAMVAVPDQQYESIRAAVKQCELITGVIETTIDLRHEGFAEKPLIVIIDKDCRKEFSEPDFVRARVMSDLSFCLQVGYDSDQKFGGFDVYYSDGFPPRCDDIEMSDEYFESIAEEVTEGGELRGTLYKNACEVLPEDVINFIKAAAITD